MTDQGEPNSLRAQSSRRGTRPRRREKTFCRGHTRLPGDPRQPTDGVTLPHNRYRYAADRRPTKLPRTVCAGWHRRATSSLNSRNCFRCCWTVRQCRSGIHAPMVLRSGTRRAVQAREYGLEFSEPGRGLFRAGHKRDRTGHLQRTHRRHQRHDLPAARTNWNHVRAAYFSAHLGDRVVAPRGMAVEVAAQLLGQASTAPTGTPSHT
jgi:hypothetical protein